MRGKNGATAGKKKRGKGATFAARSTETKRPTAKARRGAGGGAEERKRVEGLDLRGWGGIKTGMRKTAEGSSLSRQRVRDEPRNCGVGGHAKKLKEGRASPCPKIKRKRKKEEIASVRKGCGKVPGEGAQNSVVGEGQKGKERKKKKRGKGLEASRVESRKAYHPRERKENEEKCAGFLVVWWGGVGMVFKKQWKAKGKNRKKKNILRGRGRTLLRTYEAGWGPKGEGEGGRGKEINHRPLSLRGEEGPLEKGGHGSPGYGAGRDERLLGRRKKKGKGEDAPTNGTTQFKMYQVQESPRGAGGTPGRKGFGVKGERQVQPR